MTHFVAVSLPQVLVKDTREALLDSAKKWRSKFDLPVIAVAGSNGKTTTTQMVLSIIKERFQEGAWVGTEGNLNNELGVSLMLWKLRPEHQAACFEVGMNHIGEMRPLGLGDCAYDRHGHQHDARSSGVSGFFRRNCQRKRRSLCSAPASGRSRYQCRRSLRGGMAQDGRE